MYESYTLVTRKRINWQSETNTRNPQDRIVISEVTSIERYRSEHKCHPTEYQPILSHLHSCEQPPFLGTDVSTTMVRRSLSATTSRTSRPTWIIRSADRFHQCSGATSPADHLTIEPLPRWAGRVTYGGQQPTAAPTALLHLHWPLSDCRTCGGFSVVEIPIKVRVLCQYSFSPALNFL